MPGSRAHAFASRWFDPATVTRVFEPFIADWQREWQSAPPQRRPWIRVRGLAAFIIATLVSSPAILKAAPPSDVMARIFRRVIGFVAVVSMLQAIGLVTPLVTEMPFTAAVLLLLLAAIPSGAVLAFPFSMLLAVDIIRRARNLPPHVARATALKLAAAAMVFMVLLHGFVMPAANQQYRVSAFLLACEAPPLPRPSASDCAQHTTRAGMPMPMPGLREQSTLQLLQDWTGEPSTARYTRGGYIRSELSNRAVLALMPAIFVWLRWIAHDVRRPRRFWPLPIAVMVIVSWIGFFASYMWGRLAETTWHLRPGDGFWLPIVIATLIGVAQHWITSRRRPSSLEAA